MKFSETKKGNNVFSATMRGDPTAPSLEESGWSDCVQIPHGWTTEQVNKALWVNTNHRTAPACPASKFWSEEDVLLESNATHLWLFHRAVDLLASNPTGEYQTIVDFLSYQEKADENPQDPAYPWPKNTIFHDALVKGLYDADHQNPWFNSVTWQSHFYDPVVKASYSTVTMSCNQPKQSTAPIYAQHAYTMADYYLGLFFGSDNDANKLSYLIECFYYIGVMLHYFTDMTQPMHAHNYPNAVGGTNNRFHEAFETAAQQYINTAPAALKVDYASLTDENCFKFAPVDYIPNIADWISASASKIGHPSFDLALIDANGVPWALAPDAQGNDPLPANIGKYHTIDHYYTFSGVDNSPAGYKTWQAACVPVFNTTLIAAQQATAGFLIQVFNNWMTGLLYADGRTKADPRKVSDFKRIPQNPISIGCQTVYSYKGSKDQALSIYTGKIDKFATVIPKSTVHLPVLGAYGLTASINPDYPAAPNECVQAITNCDFNFINYPKLGCAGSNIEGAFTSQGSSIIGQSGNLVNYPEGLVAQRDTPDEQG